MASETVTLSAICSGGNHLTFTLTGAKEMVVASDLNDLTAPITDEDAMVFCKVLARLVKIGKTNVQARNALQAGVTVTV